MWRAGTAGRRLIGAALAAVLALPAWSAGLVTAPPGGPAPVAAVPVAGEAARTQPVDPGSLPALGTDAPGGLPPAVASALRAAGLPASALAAVVIRLDGPPSGGQPRASSAPGLAEAGALRLSVAAHEPRLVASLMKLVTTSAALDQLGPDWRWQTPVWLAGPVQDGVLHGSLHLAAAGDPTLSAERLWLLMQAVRAQGVREIRGDIVVDDSAFAAEPAGDPGAFDGEPLRPYNVLPRGLVVAQQAVLLQLRPDAAAGVARVSILPELAGVAWPEAVALDTTAPCGDWRAALRLDLTDATQPRLRGRYPLACGARDWPLAWPETAPGEHARRAIEAAWRQAGGSLTGRTRAGAAPLDQPPALRFDSPPLAEVVRAINKYSNNPMARLLFLTLGVQAAELDAQSDAARTAWRPPSRPATLAQARRAVQDWAVRRAGCHPGELVLDNGSGLSRQARASAACLAGLLQAAWASPLMPELLASLPVAGLDGTARRLGGPALAGRAHLKTGSLRDVVAAAGVVLGRSGARHAVVVLVNHEQAAAARPVLDAVLDWAHDDVPAAPMTP